MPSSLNRSFSATALDTSSLMTGKFSESCLGKRQTGRCLHVEMAELRRADTGAKHRLICAASGYMDSWRV